LTPHGIGRVRPNVVRPGPWGTHARWSNQRELGGHQIRLTQCGDWLFRRVASSL